MAPAEPSGTGAGSRGTAVPVARPVPLRASCRPPLLRCRIHPSIARSSLAFMALRLTPGGVRPRRTIRAIRGGVALARPRSRLLRRRAGCDPSGCRPGPPRVAPRAGNGGSGRGSGNGCPTRELSPVQRMKIRSGFQGSESDAVRAGHQGRRSAVGRGQRPDRCRSGPRRSSRDCAGAAAAAVPVSGAAGLWGLRQCRRRLELRAQGQPGAPGAHTLAGKVQHRDDLVQTTRAWTAGRRRSQRRGNRLLSWVKPGSVRDKDLEFFRS